MTITRNQGTVDDTWEEATGRYVDRGLDSQVYAGKAIVVDLGSRPKDTDEAGQYTIVSTYQVSIPLDSPLIVTDDIVAVTSSMRNPQIVGQMFRVKEHRFNTYAIQQKMIVELHAGRRPR